MTDNVVASVKKTEGPFEKFVLPVAAIAAGWFAGSILFTPLADAVANVDVNGSGNAGGDFGMAFGEDTAGEWVIAGLVVAMVGFYFVKSSGFMKYIGLFLLGAAASMVLTQGFGVV